MRPLNLIKKSPSSGGSKVNFMEAPLCLTYHFSKKPRRNIPPDYSLPPGGPRKKERERFEAIANSAKTWTAGKSFDAEKFTGSASRFSPPCSFGNRLSVNLTRAHRCRFANAPRHIWRIVSVAHLAAPSPPFLDGSRRGGGGRPRQDAAAGNNR